MPVDRVAAPVKARGTLLLVPFDCVRGVSVAGAAVVVVREKSGIDVEGATTARGVVVKRMLSVVTPSVSVLNEILIIVVYKITSGQQSIGSGALVRKLTLLPFSAV
jgi:hypothetical protein